MTALHRNTDDRCCNLNAVITQNLSRFVHQLHLFTGVSVLIKITPMRQTIHIYRIRISHLALFTLAFILQLLDRFYSRSGYALIGRNNQSFDAILGMNLFERKHHLSGTAIWIGNDLVLLRYKVAIDFRNDQFFVFQHSPSGRIVYDRCSHLRKLGCPFKTDRTTS